MTGRRVVQVALLATVSAAGCCHPAPEDPTTKYLQDHPPGTSEVPKNNAMPDYDYYTGSDAEHDYYVILDSTGKILSAIAPDRDPRMWPDPMPRTTDRTKWKLAPGSSAP